MCSPLRASGVSSVSPVKVCDSRWGNTLRNLHSVLPDQIKKKNKKGHRNLSINCRESAKEDFSGLSPYHVLGVEPSCSLSDLKVAFRAKVKEFHPDVCKDAKVSDVMIRHVIQAYELLSESHKSETAGRANSDPFEEPECEAFDIFVNEAVCIGTGCPYSCVKTAPHVFSFDTLYGTARVISQGHGEDDMVQLAAGQCPRNCIHYVTPCQRIILEEALESVMNSRFGSAESAVVDSLIAKASYENNRYQKPKKKQSEGSTQFVDWF